MTRSIWGFLPCVLKQISTTFFQQALALAPMPKAPLLQAWVEEKGAYAGVVGVPCLSPQSLSESQSEEGKCGVRPHPKDI